MSVIGWIFIVLVDFAAGAITHWAWREGHPLPPEHEYVSRNTRCLLEACHVALDYFEGNFTDYDEGDLAEQLSTAIAEYHTAKEE